MSKHLSKLAANFFQTKSSAAVLQSIARRGISAFVQNEKFIVVEEKNASNSQPMKFPGVWLRDNCSCPKCFHETSQSRIINWENFDTNIKVVNLQTDASAKQLKIQWSDEHSSVYELKWLKEHQFISERQQTYLDDFYRPKPQYWQGSDFDKITQKFQYNDVMNSDEALHGWLKALAVRGVAIIENSPIDKLVVRNLADRVGFIRKTTYGEEFIVQSKPGAKNFAYLSDPLPLHTDLPYYEYKPGVNILHCMVQSKSKGGSNLLVDAFHIAERMKSQHPQDYKLLAETIVDWNDIGSEDGNSFHSIWRAPVICLDKDGNYTRINYSQPQRDSQFNIPLEQVYPWYEAYAKFVRMAMQDAHAFKTKPGDVLTFNNIRLLHGRTGYDDTDENVRYIVGAYMDWDIIYSRLRVLKSKLK